MDRARLLPVGLRLMLVAPVVVGVRSLLAVAGVAEPGFYPVFFAVGGSLSGLGMVLAAVATWGRAGTFWFVVAGAAVSLLGHNVVGRLPWTAVALLGPSLVHAGTGLLLWPLRRLGLLAGLVAGLGAYLRNFAWVPGNLLLLVGAAGLFAFLWLAARDAARAD